MSVHAIAPQIPATPDIKTAEQRSRATTFEYDGYRYAGLITEPAGRDNVSPVIVMLPGIVEDITDSNHNARNLHLAVAEEFLGSKVVSIGTDGVGNTCQRLSPVSALTRRFDTMARNRSELVARQAGDERVLLLGTSMGTVLTNAMAARNLAANEPIINIDALIHVVPAIVPSGRVAEDMVCRFLTHMYGESRQLAHDADALRIGRAAIRTIVSGKACVIAGNVLNLLNGSHVDEVEKVVSRYPTGVITGDRDPLAQISMWRRLEASHRDRVIVDVKPGQGHTMPLATAETASGVLDIYQRLGRLSCRPLQPVY